ncbi:unnamed protein product [Brachionus calyciflorus]|uniref:RING-type E3 ubiquitin transferase n=1 Tax=Brachionus calyciflorus TaxID=104777 RepID=A0A813M5L4_9BILA|nr:unnamed protein product [Brachionus calyciflorus]
MDLYDGIINDLIELAESLERDKKSLSLSINSVEMKMKEKYDDLDNRISKIETFNERNVSSDINNKSWVDAVAKPIALPFSKQQLGMSILLMMEKEDEVRNSKNVIIFGLPTPEKEDVKQRQLDDKSKIEEVLDYLKMGKKQHQQDKLYITSTEWKHFYGGKKTDTSAISSAEFRRIPFHCCALSYQPFKHPYCTPEGHVFDLENIAPFLKKYGRNPVTGEPLDPKKLIKLNFYKNAKGEYHCPTTYKVFNENTHIVCIAKTGNVFSYDAVEELNIKANYLKDLLTDEPFTKKDIITIQDPSNLTKFNSNSFFFVKKNLKWEKDDSVERNDPNYYIKAISNEAKSALDELKKTYVAPSTSTSSSNFVDSSKIVKADAINAAIYSTGRVAASFTSTVMEICTTQEPAVIDEDEIRYARIRKLGKKGYVCLVTNYGRLNIELFCDQVPKTCENFIKHCANKYYKDTVFHRLIKNFMIQGGDPTGTGNGGQSIWGKKFEDEFKQNLKHDARGLLSMANSGPNTNKSQFYITFRDLPHLDNKHTVFGKLVGGSDVFNKIEYVETDKKDRPKTSIKIEDCLVFVDPYLEVDEQLKTERENALKKDDKKSDSSKEKTLADLKPVRQGVGKYISSTLLFEKKHKVSEEDELEIKSKKLKQAQSSFGNFSSW